jgi:GNAT superfamily N-acetyltransferase
MTDLLGVCVAWGDGVCVVQPETGDAVTITLADIVSGKPVPPRPSIRQRVSARDAESHKGALGPAVERVALGGWELRFDPAPVGRVLKRANSCLAMGDPGLALPRALAGIEEFYAERGRDPLAQVEAGSPEEDAFRDAGWQPLDHGESELWLASVSRVRRSLPPPVRPVELVVNGPRAVASVGSGCDPLAEGHAAIDGDWLGLHNLQVAEEHRRQGLGTAALGALLEWGAEQGATTAWLHVEVDNDPARALYDRVGFRTHHACRYLQST